MENCFRFLINVDQCLNMSNFDIFFYKLASRHKYHLNNVQMFGPTAQTSLRSAVTDIRMYLDKYPYHVGDYQIIVAMRSKFRMHAAGWEETMLYRLVHLNHELRKARIFINSRERVEKALNLIMLYDADFSVDLPELGNYMTSERFQNDCYQLLRQYGIPEGDPGQQELEKVLEAYRARPDHDPAAADLLERFLEGRRKRSGLLLEEEVWSFPEDAGGVSQSVLMEFAPFLKDQLVNFQVFEAQIDRNSRRQNILALLRVTEFINMSVERPLDTGDGVGITTLAQRCQNNWEKVWNDPELEQRYAVMLRRYQHRLNNAAIELERPRFYSAMARPLPEESIPGSNALTGSEDTFSSADVEQQGSDFKAILDRFLEGRFSTKTLRRDWQEVYGRIRSALNRMDYELKSYAEDLSRQYAGALEERKRESIIWKSNFYMAEPSTEKNISRLAHERDQRLQQLKSPHMNPALSFQDQLNMENSLEQANTAIQFYLRCISSVTALNFLGLVGVCLLMGILHYTLLQPYVLQDMSTLMYYLIYIAAVGVLMLLCWTMPYQYFRKKLKNSICSLQEDMDRYITGYFEKAKHFGSYINLLNQLDYITRYHDLLEQAYSATHRLSQGYLWHKVQIRGHLSKLQFFQGLIELSDIADEDDTEQAVPAIEGDRVSDVIDSPLYWPQS